MIVLLESSSRHQQVGDVDDGIETHAMLVNTVPEDLFENIPLFESPVDSLMPCTCECLHPLVCIIQPIRGLKELVAVLVASIRKNLFIIIQQKDDIVPGNPEIRPLSTGVGSIDPDDLSCLNTDTKLIPDSGTLELMGVPPWVERGWFIDFAISAIQSEETDAAIGLPLPVLEVDLNRATIKEDMLALLTCQINRRKVVCSYAVKVCNGFDHSPVPFSKRFLVALSKAATNTFRRIHL